MFSSWRLFCSRPVEGVSARRQCRQSSSVSVRVSSIVKRPTSFRTNLQLEQFLGDFFRRKLNVNVWSVDWNIKIPVAVIFFFLLVFVQFWLEPQLAVPVQQTAPVCRDQTTPLLAGWVKHLTPLSGPRAQLRVSVNHRLCVCCRRVTKNQTASFGPMFCSHFVFFLKNTWELTLFFITTSTSC